MGIPMLTSGIGGSGSGKDDFFKKLLDTLGSEDFQKQVASINKTIKTAQDISDTLGLNAPPPVMPQISLRAQGIGALPAPSSAGINAVAHGMTQEQLLRALMAMLSRR